MTPVAKKAFPKVRFWGDTHGAHLDAQMSTHGYITIARAHICILAALQPPARDAYSYIYIYMRARYWDTIMRAHIYVYIYIYIIGAHIYFPNIFVAGRQQYSSPGDKYICRPSDKYICRLATNIFAARATNKNCCGATNICRAATNIAS